MQGRTTEGTGLRLFGGKSVWGHRGLAGIFPENTLAAFAAAAAVSATGIEFDVHRTVDGALVVVHDDDVDRTTDGTGPVESLTLAQVRALSAGRKTHARFVHERVPLLAEVLALGADYGLALDIELKRTIHTRALVEAVVEETDAFYAGRPDAPYRPGGPGVWYSSVDPEALALLHDLRPTWRLALVVEEPFAPTRAGMADQLTRLAKAGAGVLVPPLDAVLAAPDVLLGHVPLLPYADACPCPLPAELLAAETFVGLIVNDPHRAIADLAVWEACGRHGQEGPERAALKVR